MPRSQISFQLATPLLDFILFWLLIPSWMNLFHCGFHFSCYFPHTYHFNNSYIAVFISAYTSIGHFISFPTSMSTIITFQKILQFSQHTHIKRYSLSLFSPLSLSLPPLLLSLCFSWLLVSLASTSFCGLASTGFSSSLASKGFFGFVLSGILQKSFASY